MNKFLLGFIAFFILYAGINIAYSAPLLNDTFVADTLREYVGEEFPPAKPMCNFESTDRVPIVMTPQDTVMSKNGVEGQTIKLRVKYNVFYRGKLLAARGTIATAKVETVTTQGMNGIPAMIILDRFEIPGLDGAKMKSCYVKKGLNLTYLVLPIKWALTILPPTGSLANFIVGGPAKISPINEVTIYYYPDWKLSLIHI